MNPERAANHAAYRRLKDAIARTNKPGQFVAISGGQIIADADGFDELRAHLAAAGKDPTEVLVVQAGVEYPETAVIFCAVQA
jgi:hypothetical protein